MLRRAVDRREQHPRLHLRPRRARLPQQRLEMRARRLRPAHHVLAQSRQHLRLHPDLVRQPPERLVAVHDLQRRAHEPLQPRRRIRVRLGDFERLLHVRHALLEDRPQQRVLALEVVVEEPLCDAGALRDHADGRGGEAVVREQLERRREDPVAAFLSHLSERFW